MRKRIILILQTIVIIAGIFAGFVGGVHGYYEITHENNRPAGLFYDAISGKPLTVDNPNWTGWPAMTFIPNFLATGIITIIFSAIVIAWTVLRVNRRYGSRILIMLSIIMCLFGGGFVPPLIGVMGGIMGMIRKSLDRPRVSGKVVPDLNSWKPDK
jgi:hypothetical protein